MTTVNRNKHLTGDERKIIEQGIEHGATKWTDYRTRWKTWNDMASSCWIPLSSYQEIALAHLLYDRRPTA